MNKAKIYPRTGDYQPVYLNQVVTNPNIIVGDYTMYNDFVNDPTEFEKNNVLYHYPIKWRSFDHRQILFHCLRRQISL